MKYETITVEKKDRIALITLNRPPMNTINRLMYEELNLAAGELSSDPAVKAVVITGSGEKAFSAGLDLKEVRGKSITDIMDFWSCSRKASEAVEAIEKPVIAAINNIALGAAMELSLCCDIRIASEEARFGQPEVNLGIVPGGGATQRLPRLIGSAKAKELFFTGKMFDAKTALDIGLVSQVVPGTQLMENVMALSNNIAAKSGMTLKLIKTAVNIGLNMDLHSALQHEGECFLISYASEDCREGMAAFLEKRAPMFKDR